MDLSHLITLCEAYHSDKNRDFTKLPGLSILRREAPSDIEAFIYEPVMCLILQGSKFTSVGDQIVELKPGDALLVSHDLPVVSRITTATKQEPYIALNLSLDLALVQSLFDHITDTPLSDAPARPLSNGPADQDWLAPLVRYFELMDKPLDAKVLGPGMLREIHYRLLLSPIGKMLRKLLVADSHASRIAKSIGQLRRAFRTKLSVAELAETSGMSVSSFHEHFKSITGTTPLQYQKGLRLIEARALLVGQSRSVSEVAYAVGYDSPTHFSRDYRTKFGLPPSKDN